MADSTYEIVRNHVATEASLSLNDKDWAYSQDSRRIAVQDGGTKRYYWDSTRLADVTASYGTALIGSPGITGITPNGGSSGSSATLANMLAGFRDSVVLKSPYSSTINTIQPVADYVALTIKAYGSQTADLFRVSKVDGTVMVNVDASGNLGMTNSLTGAYSISLTNSNNVNGGAHAIGYLFVGGASGGDPFLNFRVSGVTDWSVGVDNSSNDNFKISNSSALGTSDVISLDPSASQFTSTYDFYTSRTKVGAGTYIQVNNQDNTNGASDAGFFATVNGGSAGDCYVHFNNSVNQWRIGLDNSDSDKFKISQAATLGTNDVLTISTAGNVSIGLGDLTLSRANVAGNVTSYVINSDNTNGGSNAYLNISTGGASAGDAMLGFGVAGAGSVAYLLGVDNSDSDKFKISNGGALGATDFLTINGTGVTLPCGFLGIGSGGTNWELDITKSKPGAEMRIWLYNSSNTANSTASVRLMVAGDTAGNPDIHFDLNAGAATSWTMGLDNADSDKFKIASSSALGSNDRLIINTGGLVEIVSGLKVTGGYVLVPNLGSAPGSPSNGMIYYDTVSGHIRGYAAGAGGWGTIV